MSKLYVGFNVKLVDNPGEMGRYMSDKTGVAFSEAQWQELERQRDIYKYMMASVPVPSELLTPFPKKPSNTNPDGIISLGSCFFFNFSFSLVTMCSCSLVIMFDATLRWLDNVLNFKKFLPLSHGNGMFW